MFRSLQPAFMESHFHPSRGSVSKFSLLRADLTAASTWWAPHRPPQADAQASSVEVPKMQKKKKKKVLLVHDAGLIAPHASAYAIGRLGCGGADTTFEQPQRIYIFSILPAPPHSPRIPTTAFPSEFVKVHDHRRILTFFEIVITTLSKRPYWAK